MPIPRTNAQPRTTAKDQAYHQIREWIIDGTLMPGEKLAEVNLAQAIHVSRTPIREALLKLTEDGFVTSTVGKVTRVAGINVDDATDLYTPMAAIEGAAARLAAQRITSVELAQLRQLADQYAATFQKAPINQVRAADRKFHEQLLTSAHNGYLQQFSSLLYAHIKRYETFFFATMQQTDQPDTGAHDALLDALSHHDGDAAAQAITQDWLATLAVLTNANN